MEKLRLPLAAPSFLLSNSRPVRGRIHLIWKINELCYEGSLAEVRRLSPHENYRPLPDRASPRLKAIAIEYATTGVRETLGALTKLEYESRRLGSRVGEETQGPHAIPQKSNPRDPLSG